MRLAPKHEVPKSAYAESQSFQAQPEATHNPRELGTHQLARLGCGASLESRLKKELLCWTDFEKYDEGLIDHSWFLGRDEDE